MKNIILKGDIHANTTQLINFLYHNKEVLTDEDIIIILGDFGLIWKDKEKTTKVLEELGNNKCKIAFLDGNHENFDLIKEMETIINWNGGRAGLLPGGIIHLLRGEVYQIGNKRVGVCGGANSVDKWHRTEGISWWRQEEITEQDIANLLLKTVTNCHLDIMLSHDCPSSLVPQVTAFSQINKSEISKSQERLEIINSTLKIDKWYFGHWHLDLKFDNKFECIFNNFKVIECD